MWSFRAKLILGFGGLVLVLLTVSLLAAAIVHFYSNTTRQVLADDLSSIRAANAMDESVEMIDEALHAQIRGESRADPAAVRNQIRAFDAALSLQNQHVTLPGESEATDQLNKLWHEYQAAVDQMLDPSRTDSEHADLYNQRLSTLAVQIKAASQRVFDINADAIPSLHGEAFVAARRAESAMFLLALGGVLVAIIFAVLIGRGILKPVNTLIRSVQEIERGNLDLAVPVESSDELGRLAAAFNTMAVQLREFRRIDHEKLIRTQRTTQLAIDSLPDAVVVINPEGRIEIANDLALRLFALRPGAAVTDLPQAWLAELHRRVGRDREPSGTGTLASAIQITQGDRELFFLPKALPILDEDKRFIGCTIVLAELTDLRRLDDMKNSLLAMASHELKTPLTSMRMILPLILTEKLGALTARQRELLAAARDDSDHLHQIVEDLLDMGRIESGKAMMEIRPLYAEQIVRRAVEPLAGVFEDHGLTLQLELPPTPLVVLADEARMGHVLGNLLGNAVKYTPRGGRVRVAVRSNPDGVEFAVADTGTGIPKQYLHRVFEKFFRVPGQATSGGSGLGLAIVDDIIKGHHGQITVESDEGRGATFRFTIPHGTVAEEISAGVEAQKGKFEIRSRPAGTKFE